jgi:hypothetical protein
MGMGVFWRYFPIKRVVGMTLSGIVFIASWVSPISEALTKYSGVNWVAVISGVLTLVFAYWVIVDLYLKLESKPAIILKELGMVALTLPTTRPLRLEYYYNILIVNSSPDKTLGIIDIILELKYKSRTKYIFPFIGIPESDFGVIGGAKKGEIPGNLLLQPNESREGQLVFVEELNDADLPNFSKILSHNIIIRDTQRRKYIFPTSIDKMSEDYHI